MAGILSDFFGLGGGGAPQPQPGMNAPAQTQPQQPGGLLGLGGNLGGLLDLSDPQKAVAFQLIANGAKAPNQMMDGVPQALTTATKLQELKREKEKEVNARNATVEWLKTNAPSYAAAVANGMDPKEAFSAALQEKQNGQLLDRWKQQQDYLNNTPDAVQKRQLQQAQIDALNTKADPYAARTEAADAMGLPEGDPRRTEYILTGKTGKPQTLSPTDKKEIWKSEDELPVLDNTISTLQRAKDLNDKTYTGRGAGVYGTIGATIPGAGYILDEDKAKNTLEFGKLMSEEAIKNMSATLKGATTDQEMNRFTEIMADPATPPEIRARTIDRMLQLAQRQKEIKLQRINELRGTPQQSTSPKAAQPSGQGTAGNGIKWSIEE